MLPVQVTLCGGTHPVLLPGRLPGAAGGVAVEGGAHHAQAVPDLYLGVGRGAVRLDVVDGELHSRVSALNALI